MSPLHGAGILGDFLIDPAGFVPSVLQTAGRFLATSWPWLIPATTVSIAVALCLRTAVLRRRRAAFAAGSRLVTIQAPPTVPAKGGEVLWAQLSGLLRPWHQRLLHGQPHLGFEYAWSRAGLTIRLWLPGTIPTSLVRRAVEAAWPGAHTTLTDATAPLPAGHACTAGALRLARPENLPLRTDHPEDPLRALLQAATAMNEQEHALVQVLARPATGARLRRARRSARRLKAGHTAPRISSLFRLFAHAPQRTSAATTDPSHGVEVRDSAGKLLGPQWEVAIGYAVTQGVKVTEPSKTTDRLRGRAHAIASAFSLFAGRNWLTRHRLTRPHPVLADRYFPRRGDLLSVPELAALAHLPVDPDAPGLVRAGARAVAPPPTVPAPGPGVKPLGHADTGTPRAVGLAVTDARQHTHLTGATGSGKSTLIAHLVLDDVRAGRGAVVIDPKGDLVTDLLHRLPASCADRLVVIDPDDPHTPPCLNVLDGSDIDVVVDNITGIFRRIFAAFWGPRTDDIMRAACLTLLRHAQTTHRLVTLADIPRLLGESAYRLRIIPTIKDPVLRGFWTWYESMSEPMRAAVIGPVMNKLRAFLLRAFARQTIASGESTFHLTDVLDGGILLARLPKGALGEETCRLLGSFIVAKTWQATAARARTPEHQRIDASLYVDETHNFLNLPYPLEDMLAEARGYRLAMTLAHQNLAQLPRDLREGISANARNKVFFNASPEDAAQLERHTLPLLGAHDLSHLGPFQAAAHLLHGGAEQAAFTLTTRPLPPPSPGRSSELRAAAARRVGGSATCATHIPL
ncbi:type IV secretion system DNA-binding domain-containing protein [Streptomyces sp. TRM66268-LWL]|uniref:Type IV secretion system DNA-binding domain-containing protein n=1 Tax=Streptomyces polyasparticus TaxID=2767826 RepID=A0ABR7SR97_9ACTN|nr:type IV secretion system DNA-binding domain-containing protein [Streptomyces polyasparticus]MBC9718035.1 type IV secretion system DNA-binding domain-containing protein [Streptomyces polyasparticus]